ncbi:MAG: hypothetical protein AAF570_08435, partial [Bacteroidota bacterium]
MIVPVSLGQQLISPPSVIVVRHFDFSAPQNGYAIAYDGNDWSIDRISNSGNSWQTLSAPNGAEFGFHMRRISTVDAMHDYFLCDRMWFAATDDGGQTWKHIQQIDSIRDPYALQFLDSLTGYAVGGNGFVGASRVSAYKTTDGGASWTSVYIPASEYLLADVCGADEDRFVYFMNADTGFSVKSDSLIFRTTDGAATWDSVAVNSNALNRIRQFPNGVLLAEGFPNKKSLDSGATW